MTDIACLSCDRFHPLVGADIALVDDAGAVVLTAKLRSATEHLRATAPDAPRTAFSLVLTAPEPCAVTGGHLRLAHTQLGIIGPVNIVRVFPGRLDTREAAFEICFN